MSYDLFQSMLVFAIVGYCFMQLLRKLMPHTMRRAQARLAQLTRVSALHPTLPLVKSGGCSDCSSCGACRNIQSTAPASAQ